jgi:D-alanine-D-alanine ligase
MQSEQDAKFQDARFRVVVLAGGESAEREVSQRSGAGVAAALSECGHHVTLVDPATEPLAGINWNDFDACFIALHGGAGEDGRVQAQLARLGVPYTGSGPQACRLAMSKLASKQRFVSEDVPTPPYVLVAADDRLAGIARRVSALGYPVVLKPDDQGSSVGVTIARDSAELAIALAKSRRFGGNVLVEPLVVGREFTVAMLDEHPLPLIEVVSPEPVFSYDAKYNSSLTEYKFDFVLDDALRAAIDEAAIGAVRALGVSGLSRVDVMLGHDGSVWVLEVNTIPGMTARSLAPLAAARAGLDMPALCDHLVQRCLAAAGVA